MASLILAPGSRHRILQGHPWVFRSEIARVDGNPADGDTVELLHSQGRFMAMGIYNSRSQIVFRRYSTEKVPLDRPLIAKKLEAALAYRRSLKLEAHRGAQRLVWSESDGLPGLIVDRYDDVVVLQTVTLGMARQEETIADILQDLLKPVAIIARNDVLVRKIEGLPVEKKVLRGAWGGQLKKVQMNGVTVPVDVWNGHKTGFYIDQADNHAVIGQMAAGRRVLDCFTNQGGFALAAKHAGAAEVVAIDQSSEALNLGRSVSTENNWNINWVEGNVFDCLRAYEKEKRRFDLVILDPPSFTKTKEQLDSAMRGYHEIHLRAMKLLEPGGILATFSCSHNVTAAAWEEMLVKTGAETRSFWRLRQRLTQGPDHPVLNGFPESEYLRGYVLERI